MTMFGFSSKTKFVIFGFVIGGFVHTENMIEEEA